jgi:hypothetical protein
MAVNDRSSGTRGSAGAVCEACQERWPPADLLEPAHKDPAIILPHEREDEFLPSLDYGLNPAPFPQSALGQMSDGIAPPP